MNGVKAVASVWRRSWSALLISATVGLLALAQGTSAADLANKPECSTTRQAKAVIAGAASRTALVTDVAESVPGDPDSCVPSYCEAVRDEPEDTRAAVGAGLSDAFNILVADEDQRLALSVLRSACSGYCDDVVVTSFAAAQGTTNARLCEMAGGRPGLSGYQPGKGNGSGGQPASHN